jgi:hypothetical protein
VWFADVTDKVDGQHDDDKGYCHDPQDHVLGI